LLAVPGYGTCVLWIVTVYFPTVVKEAMMIEPIETESKEILNAFIEAMVEIAEQSKSEPKKLKSTPTTTPVCHPNETTAAKSLNIAYLRRSRI